MTASGPTRRTDATCRRRERSRLSAAALFSDHVSAGRWSVVRSRELIRLFRTPSNHTLSGRRPRVAFIVAPPCRADRSCRHAGLGAVGGGDGDRAPIERRPPLRVWERRIAGDAGKTQARLSVIIRSLSRGRVECGVIESDAPTMSRVLPSPCGHRVRRPRVEWPSRYCRGPTIIGTETYAKPYRRV